MLIGYVRVSKADGSQTLAPQRDALLAAGVDASRIYEDLASGRHDARPGLTACLKALQPGNTLVLWKLDRLGRDLRHLVITAEALRERGIAATRQLAKRQLTWLRGMPQRQHIAAEAPDAARQVLQLVGRLGAVPV